MSDKPKKQRSRADADLEWEIREGRKFSLAEAIGRLAGPGAMKGVSPVPRMQQAVVEIARWLNEHLPAANGELEMVLVRWIEGSELLLNNFEQPFIVLAACSQTAIDSDYLLRELVREADVEWGRSKKSGPFSKKWVRRRITMIRTRLNSSAMSSPVCSSN